MADEVSLRIVPLDLKDANALVKEWHSHHRPVIGHKFSIGARDGKDDGLVGCVIVSRPVAQALDDGRTLEVTRLCSARPKATGELVTDRHVASRLLAAAADACFKCDPMQTWVVGSTAWMPVVLGKQAPANADIDLVFAEPGMAVEFIGNAHRKLGDLSSPYNYSTRPNTKNGYKLTVAMKDEGLLDAWDLPMRGKETRSIAEEISGFKNAWERVAVMVGANPGELSAVTRLVKADAYGARTAPSYSYGS